MSDVEVKLLGPLELVVGGRPVELRRRKQRALLALLALRAGEVISTDRLVDELWGETPPKAAVGSLQNLVSELRKLIGPERLVTRAPGYVLDVERQLVDVHRFERAVREGEGLREALALWRGPALADVAFQPFAQAEIARLEELRTTAREQLFDVELAEGRHAQVVAELEAFVAEHRLRERPRGQLMLALYRSGRQADALEAFRRARETLVEELGIDPSAELQQLEQAILRHDPALSLDGAAERPAGPDRRKAVTVLFVDLVGSSELAETLDPEVFRSVLDRYFAVVRAAVVRHGGVVEKFIGDAAMAAFGVPTLHEDDALRAVRAAAEIRDGLTELNGDLAEEHGIALQVRIGVDTGEVLAGDPDSGQAFVTGPPVNQAMRLEQAALPGEILIGETTYALVKHAVEAEPAEVEPPAFRVGGVEDAARPLGAATLVGRRNELAWLQAAFAGVQAERRSRVVTVLGDAGVGKSRLAAEFVGGLRGARTVVGRCVSYGEGATFLPLAAIVREAVPERPRATITELLEGDGQAPLVAERVTQLIGDGGAAASPGEVFWAVRRFLEALARRRPLVVVLEDIHWAEPTLLDLVDYLDSWTAEAPLLVLCLSRRDLLEHRPGWGAPNGVLTLDPLAKEDAEALVDEIASDALDEPARRGIVETAEGNPLFLEQLLAFVEEAGADALTSVPPTVEALLAGRVDRLEADERAVLERAAVIGRDFSRAALLALSPPGELAGLDSRLATLARRGLVRARRGEDDAHRFHHVLVRDVAYGGTTKAARAELHERYGWWLEQRDGPDEIVGYHLEQAHLYAAELRPTDAAVPTLAQRAGERLAAAGVRAWKGADTPAAVNLLGRGSRLLQSPAMRAETLCELGTAQRYTDFEAADSVLSEAAECARDAGDRRIELRAEIELAHLRLFTDPQADPGELVELVETAIPVFEEHGDERALARAWRNLGYLRGSMQGRCAEWLEAAERAAASYRRTGWSTAGCSLEAAAAMFYGPMPVPEVLLRCEALLDETTERVGRGQILVYVAGAHALSERYENAFALLDEADGILAELGEEYARFDNCGRIRGLTHVLDGDPEAADAVLRESFDVLERMGDKAGGSSIAAQLGDVAFTDGRLADAERWSRLATVHAPVGDRVSQVNWRSLAGKVQAAQGRVEDGEALVLEALALIEETDALSHRGSVHLDLASVLCAGGRHLEAADRIRQALALFENKGNLACKHLAETKLDALAVA